MISRLAILGPGLLGGSIALAVRQRLPQVKVAMWARREAAVAEALARGLADIASTDLKEIVADSDFITFCIPIESMPSLAKAAVPFLTGNPIITDVGSVKEPVVKALRTIFEGAGRFIGSHPMAGSEQAGLGAARADLFAGAVCLVTPDERTAPDNTAVVERFWAALGGVTHTLSPGAHDEAVAFVSHLPHLVAAALIDLVCAENPNSLNFCGKGFLDTTRVASGQAAMWTGIFSSNRNHLKKSVQAMIAKLEEASLLLDGPNEAGIRGFLEEAKKRRDRLASRK